MEPDDGDGHMEIVEEVGEYLEGSPLIPTGAFVRKGRAPPKRQPGSDCDAYGRRLNMSPGTGFSIVPDFQSNVEAIEEDIGVLNSIIAKSPAGDKSSVLPSKAVSDADNGSSVPSGLLPSSPAVSTANERRSLPGKPASLSYESAGATKLAAGGDRSAASGVGASSGGAAARSPRPANAGSPKESPNPSFAASNQNGQSGAKNGSPGERSSQVTALSLPAVGPAYQKGAASSASLAEGRSHGRPNLANEAPQSTVPVPNEGCSPAPTAKATAPCPSATPAVPTARSRSSPFTHAGRAQCVPSAPNVAVAADGGGGSSAPPDPAKPFSQKSRRGSFADWSSGYELPSPSFLKFTGSGRLKGTDEGKTPPTLTNQGAAAAKGGGGGSAERGAPAAATRSRRSSIAGRVKAFEEAALQGNGLAPSLPLASRNGVMARPRNRSKTSEGRAPAKNNAASTAHDSGATGQLNGNSKGESPPSIQQSSAPTPPGTVRTLGRTNAAAPLAAPRHTARRRSRTSSAKDNVASASSAGETVPVASAQMPNGAAAGTVDSATKKPSPPTTVRPTAEAAPRRHPGPQPSLSSAVVACPATASNADQGSGRDDLGKTPEPKKADGAGQEDGGGRPDSDTPTPASGDRPKNRRQASQRPTVRSRIPEIAEL